MPSEIFTAPYEPMRRRRTPTAGAGLGLSIAKGIVEAHGGRIVLEQPGKGTCFRVHLPIEMPDRPDGHAVPGPGGGAGPAPRGARSV